MNRVEVHEILNLILSLPDADKHIYFSDGYWHVTSEWLCGSFCGRSFPEATIEESAEKLIDYLYEHIGHNSMVGRCVTNSGFPDLVSVRDYCIENIEE